MDNLYLSRFNWDPDNNEGDLAYDGSNGPPKRDLTARERDILCRIITEILGHARREAPQWNEGDEHMPIPGWDWPGVPISIGERDFFLILQRIRKAIDPRDYE
jgi:hypothetical protein